jgi:hypothetical protein
MVRSHFPVMDDVCLAGRALRFVFISRARLSILRWKRIMGFSGPSGSSTHLNEFISQNVAGVWSDCLKMTCELDLARLTFFSFSPKPIHNPLLPNHLQSRANYLAHFRNPDDFLNRIHFATIFSVPTDSLFILFVSRKSQPHSLCRVPYRPPGACDAAVPLSASASLKRFHFAITLFGSRRFSLRAFRLSENSTIFPAAYRIAAPALTTPQFYFLHPPALSDFISPLFFGTRRPSFYSFRFSKKPTPFSLPRTVSPPGRLRRRSSTFCIRQPQAISFRHYPLRLLPIFSPCLSPVENTHHSPQCILHRALALTAPQVLLVVRRRRAALFLSPR